MPKFYKRTVFTVFLAGCLLMYGYWTRIHIGYNFRFFQQHQKTFLSPKTSVQLFDNGMERDNYNLITSTNWERLTNGHHVLRKSESVVCSFCSTIVFDKKTESYHVGDVVTVDIIVKDVLGRRKVTGGDLVRIWIKDPINGACATGYVEDKNNGYYRGTVKLLWAGNATIVARISAPLEMIGFLYRTVKSGRTMLLMKGLFKRGQVKEFQKCSPIHERHPRACNLTIWNSGLPWYCDMPHNTSCKDWLTVAYYNPKFNYTVQEKEMFNRIHQYQSMEGNIRLHVTMN